MTKQSQDPRHLWTYRGQQRPDFAIEPKNGQESVWDYPRPPICRDDPREVVVRWNGVEIARSNSAVRILETASPPTVYLPPKDVDLTSLVKVQMQTHCEWKGHASYWAVELPTSKELKVAAWAYPNPSASFASIANYISFYPAVVECSLGGEEVRPQPGDFYGGWVTDEIVGPYKGEVGRGGW